ncbi:MAG: hypothetical protein KGI54_01175 [Pseudomonadota bacterium]|nr:hypothetical protein [Pseudomonadota bacterium]
MSDAISRKVKWGRLKALLIASIFLVPLVAAYVVFYWFRPHSFDNHGELLPPKPLQNASAKLENGTSFSVDTLKGKWVLIMSAPGSCDKECRYALYAMRQVRISENLDRNRIERVWLVTGHSRPGFQLERYFTGTWEVADPDKEISSQLPIPSGQEAIIFIMDPRGNVMMRYGPHPAMGDIASDLHRLLEASSIG